MQEDVFKNGANGNVIAIPKDMVFASELTDEGGILNIKGTNGNDAIARRIVTLEDGIVEIHPVDSHDADGNIVWKKKTFTAGIEFTMAIDAIRTTNTEVPLESIELHM